MDVPSLRSQSPIAPYTWPGSLRCTLARPPLLLTIFGLCLYLLTSGAYLDNPDGRSMYSVTRSLALRGSIAIPEPERLDSLFEKVGRDGEIYSKYGLVQPLLQLPLFLVGRWLSPGDERHATETAVALFQALLTALTLPLLWHLARMLFDSERVALALALIYGTATMAWLYATLTYTEPLLTLIVLAICWLLVRAERGPAEGLISRLALAGSLTGVAILTKYPAVIYTPALLWYTWYISRRRQRAWFAFVTPLLLGVLGLAGYNVWRYADILNTGYHIKELTRLPRPPWYGLYTLFFSVGKSIFIYAPPLLLALYAFPRFVRRFGLFGRFVVLALCSSVVFYAVVSPWCGAWSPGPRYHLPLLPLALLPLGCVLLRWSELAYWKRLACINVVAMGVLIQIISVSISYSDTLVLLQTLTRGQYAWGFWFFDPDYAPLPWQGRLLFSALSRSMTGHSLLPAIGVGLSSRNPAAPMDQINCWFAQLPPDAVTGRFLAGGLVLVLIGMIIQLVRWYRQPCLYADTCGEAAHANTGERSPTRDSMACDHYMGVGTEPDCPVVD